MGKWQTARSRAWNDTKEWVIGNNFRTWFIVAIILAVFTPMITAILSPVDTSRLMNGVYGFLGALAALVLAVMVVYLCHLVITPYRQRNEARNEVEKLNNYISDLKQEKTEDKLEIEVGEIIIAPTGVVIANINLSPSKRMQLAEIILECRDKSVQGLIQGDIKLPHFIETSATYDVEFQVFGDVNYARAWELEEQRRLAYRQGRREAKLKIIADAREWLSSGFPIPTKIDEPQFILPYSMSKIGELTVEKDQRGYKMTLPLSLRFKNQDPRKRMWVEGFVMVGFDTFLKDGTKESYLLQSVGGRYPVEFGPGDENEIDYELETYNFDTEPVLGDTVHCHWDEIGKVITQYGRMSLPLLESFDVRVRKAT